MSDTAREAAHSVINQYEPVHDWVVDEAIDAYEAELQHQARDNDTADSNVLLTRSDFTGTVYVVTKWKDLGDGQIEAVEKYDVTEQFRKLVEQQS